ncbi:hypothetical protein ACIOZL_29985 [Streptomyces sp. NPDC087769]
MRSDAVLFEVSAGRIGVVHHDTAEAPHAVMVLLGTCRLARSFD